MSKRRVVISGLGAVTPFGVGVRLLWESLIAGRSGIGLISRFDASKHRCQIAGEVRDFNPLDFMEERDTLRMDRFVQFAMAAAIEAVRDAGLELPGGEADRTGVIVGTGMGGVPKFIEDYEKFKKFGANRTPIPYLLPASLPNMAAGWISMKFNARGPNSAVSTACAAGSHAIGDAFRLIQLGYADLMLAGGCEAITTGVIFCGFDSLRALSTRNDVPQKASRPFDAQRDGFVLGEGAGIVILEELEHAQARGAKIYAELIGYSMTADAHHATAPAPQGEGAARALSLALADAGLGANQIDYICAHGTSTPYNDLAETQAIKKVFGSYCAQLPVSSIKSMIGHLLGASGAVATIATALALQEGVIPPTINYETPDPTCDLDVVPNQARRQPIGTALVNAFAFGGTNAVLALQKLNGQGP